MELIQLYLHAHVVQITGSLVTIEECEPLIPQNLTLNGTITVCTLTDYQLLLQRYARWYRCCGSSDRSADSHTPGCNGCSSNGNVPRNRYPLRWDRT